jgi:phosphoenolpyruvate phosphomutase
MQRAAREIKATRSARTLEDDIAPLSEVFRLQDVADRERAERAYLSQGSGLRAVLLAASRGEGMDALTERKPKAMISVGGEPVIERMLRQLRGEGVRDIAIVRGYCAQALAPAGVRFFDNRRWMETGELGSLACAREMLEGDVIIAYGDLVLRRHLLHELVSAEAPMTVLVDGRKEQPGARAARSVRDRVRATSPEPLLGDERPVYLCEVGPEVPASEAHGEWMGLVRIRSTGVARFRQVLEKVLAQPQGEQKSLTAVLNELARADENAVRVQYVQGDWMDINSLLDVASSLGSP